MILIKICSSSVFVLTCHLVNERNFFFFHFIRSFVFIFLLLSQRRAGETTRDFFSSPSSPLSSVRRVSLYGGAAPYRSREGLSTRSAADSEQIQLRIDPMHSDLDDEILGLHGQVSQLKNIAQEIGSEAKFQRDFLDELQMTLMRAQAGVKNNIRKLNLSIIRSGNNHIMHVVLFALVLFFILYMWSKMFKR